MPKESLVWTGKNLAEVKRFYKNVAHYPREEGDESYRDASQHPDNLHIEADGRTIIAAVGDTITKDADGRVTVEQTAKQRPVATGTIIAPGRAIHAEATDRARGKGTS